MSTAPDSANDVVFAAIRSIRANASPSMETLGASKTLRTLTYAMKGFVIQPFDVRTVTRTMSG